MRLLRKICMVKRGRRPCSSSGNRGFTLLELLISLSLLALIVVIMMGAMRISSRSVTVAERKMDAQERFRTVLAVMDAQIQSHVPLTYEEDGNKKYYFKGDRKTFRFSTNYSIWGGRRGYVVVNYKVESDNAGNDVLYAGERIPGIEGLREIYLLEASGISFEYFYKSPEEEQGKWIDSLTSGTSIPEKVKVNLGQGIKGISLIFPVRVGGEMTPIEGGPAAQ